VNVRDLGGLGGDPPPLSPAGSRAHRLIEDTIRRFYPSAVVVPGLVLGATDARHYTAIADGVYHFAPFVLRGEQREGIHGTNERVRVADLETGVGFYRELMRD
jgi:carboxypeptidase PM20D1